jgi:hypothetical protein
MKKKIGLGIVFGCLIVLWIWKDTPTVNLRHAQPTPTLSPSPGENAAVRSESQSQVQKRIQETISKETHWKRFVEEFGPNLRGQFSKTGRLRSVEGAIGRGTAANEDFRPDDPEKVKKRAQEVLAAAEDLIGLRSDWPLGWSKIQGNSISAQIFFNETYNGLKVAPVGSVKIDLGTRGELLALYSDYDPDIKMVNQVRFSSDEGKLKAIAAVHVAPGSSLQVDGGDKMIWVSEKGGHFAYQYWVEGRQIVIDAETGSVLFNRNRRRT